MCVVGEAGTGQTELIRRCVQPMFDDRDIQTLGAKVSKKAVRIPSTRGDVRVDMTIWDIMGQKGFRGLLKEAYFYGSRGIMAVCDVTRRSTLDDLDDWIEGVFSIAGRVPVVIVVNRSETVDEGQFGPEEVRLLAGVYEAPYYFTSSVSGEKVNIAFQTLAKLVVESWLERNQPGLQRQVSSTCSGPRQYYGASATRKWLCWAWRLGRPKDSPHEIRGA